MNNECTCKPVHTDTSVSCPIGLYQAGIQRGRAETEKWEDGPDDEWSDAIEKAFPTRSGAHAEYAHRHANGQ